MKKINLFDKTISPLSDGKGCPVERGGVWELPRRTPCATPSWKEGEHKVPSFRGNAESPRCCRELVCGKTDGIPLFSGMTKKICHKFPSREGWRVAPAGVWFAALVALFVATPSFAEPTELDKKTVASKAYVDTKQDIIETGLVEFEGDDATINVPSVVTTNAAGTGVSGNQIGFMTLSAFAPTASPFLEFKDRDDGDSFVPSAALVAQGLAGRQTILPAAWTDTTNSIGMASTGGQTIDLGANAGEVGQRYITASGSQPLTQKSGADNVILYINGTKTLAQYQTSNFGGTGYYATLNQNYIKGALVSLELLKDVYSALHNEIQNATPTGTPGNVAMYDATTGALGDGVATYDGSTTYNASTDADKIAVMSGVQRKKECGGYEPAPAGQPAHDGTHPGDEDYCWLWIFPD